MKQLTKMTLGNGVLSIFIATVFYLIGSGLYVYYNQQPQLLAEMSNEVIKQDQIFAYFIAYALPVGVTGILLAAIYAASQSTLSTGLNSVATSWVLDIQAIVSKKEIPMKRQTKIAQYVSLGVGIASIVVAMILAESDIKSAYEWFNAFMGLVLGVLGGTFALGAFTKKATNVGAYVAFAVAAVLIVIIKYNPFKVAFFADISSWAYSLISISVSVVVGLIVSAIHRKVKGITEEAPEGSTVYTARIKKTEEADK